MNTTADLYYVLLKEWCDGLVSLQLLNIQRKELHGGIICPACGRMHGRTGDAILPMMYMAKHTGNSKYLTCAKALFQWSNNMFHEKGYYVNDLDNDWKGITVFFCIQLGETLQSFSDLLTEDEVADWRKRYFLTAEYVRLNIDKIGGTVNYPVCGTYAMALAGQLSDGIGKELYLKKAHQLAALSCKHISESGILFGEGHPCDAVTAKGARAVDIGYNVEESIPALLEYCCLEKDETTKELAMKALETHLKFFLPDGGLDNSFGSRNYKWSYWGSRTSDGIQAAAALLGKECPEFEKNAYQNAKLLQKCTHDGLLYGGPMYYEAGMPPCIHHTFCHAKVLAKALMILKKNTPPKAVSVKNTARKTHSHRTIEYFPEIRTYLVESENWRATLTDYDYEYCRASHATGGAMTLLRHKSIGLICAGSLNRYYIVEPNNMQLLRAEGDICLTPRIEYSENGIKYRNIQDLKAGFDCIKSEKTVDFRAKGFMKDENQSGNETCRMRYTISDTEVTFQMQCSHEAFFYLPLICNKEELITCVSEQELVLQKGESALQLYTDGKFIIDDTSHRIFNPVGGFMAYPAAIRLTPGIIYSIALRAES